MSDEESDYDTPPAKIPISSRAELKDHSKCVSALSLDPSGSSIISGGHDYSMRFWNFNGMDRSLKSYRAILPWDGYQIKDIQYSRRGDRCLVASAAVHVKLYDREGRHLKDYNKGDPYIRDMKKTQGHIAALTCCQWNPTDENVFMTASLDSTIRIWDADVHRYQRTVLVARHSGGSRLSAAVTAATFSHDGKLIFSASQDGSISFWDWNSTNWKPKQTISNAHEQNTETSRLAVSSDRINLVSRGGDHTLKLWDTRMFSSPIKEITNLQNNYQETDVVFSIDEKVILTGTSADSGQNGKLVIFDRYSLDRIDEIDVGNRSVTRVAWHDKINQIFLGLSDGAIMGLYDSEISSKGLMISLAKAVKRKVEDSYSNVNKIYAPHALPMFQEGDDMDNERSRKRRDPVQSHRPEPRKTGLFGPGKHGQIGFSETQSMMSMIIKDTSRDENPREALLKHAKAAEENPMWIDHVYKANQPQRIFDEETEETDPKSKKKK